MGATSTIGIPPTLTLSGLLDVAVPGGVPDVPQAASEATSVVAASNEKSLVLTMKIHQTLALSVSRPMVCPAQGGDDVHCGGAAPTLMCRMTAAMVTSRVN